MQNAVLAENLNNFRLINSEYTLLTPKNSPSKRLSRTVEVDKLGILTSFIVYLFFETQETRLKY